MGTCVGGVDGGGRGWGHVWEELMEEEGGGSCVGGVDAIHPHCPVLISRVFLVKSFAHLISHS